MHFERRFRLAPVSALLAVSALLTACAGSAPTLDTSAEMTFDGLYPVKGGSADQAWARQDVDFSQYKKIMLQGVGIEYRPGGETMRSSFGRASADYYQMKRSQKERFEEVVREAFVEELGKSERFTITNEPGPDVLLIRGGLLDVVSYVPPEPVGMVDIYLSSVGEATLVLEIRDSVSDAIMVRAVDRRAAENSFGLTESTRINNITEIRRLARTWGRLLRNGLDTYAAPKE